jgi:hypothetical protein
MAYIIGPSGASYIPPCDLPNNLGMITYNSSNNNLYLNSYGVAPAILINFRRAIAKVLDATSDAKVLCVGDSTTAGYGSSNTGTPQFTSFPARLAYLLNSYVAPAAMGLGVPPTTSVAVNDGRWSAGTGWASYAIGAGENASYLHTGPGTAALTYTPGGALATDTYDATSPGNGTLTATATGGNSHWRFPSHAKHFGDSFACKVHLHGFGSINK